VSPSTIGGYCAELLEEEKNEKTEKKKKQTTENSQGPL
jgi:hypothetical protein